MILASPGAVQVSVDSVQLAGSMLQALSVHACVNHFETALSAVIPATFDEQR